MTNREKAIVEAYTGTCMLVGDGRVIVHIDDSEVMECFVKNAEEEPS